MKKIEISIKDLLVAIIHRWWVVLLGVIIGLGLGYISQKPIQTSFGPTFEEQMQIYEKRMEEYQKEAASIEDGYKSSERITKAFTNVFINTTDYFKDSLLFSVNPFNAKKAFKTFSVSPEVDVQGFSSGDLIDYYIESIESVSLRELLNKDFPEEMDESIVKELITVKKINDSTMSIQCYVVEDTRIDAEEIVDAIYQFLQDNVTKYPVQGRFVPVDSGVVSHVDKELEAYISSIIINYSRNRTEYDKRAGIMSQLKNELDQFQKGRKPVKPVPLENVEQPLNVKKMVVGALIGAVLSVLIVVVYFLLKLPVQTSKQIKEQLGIRYVGRLNNILLESPEKNAQYRLVYANIEEDLLDKPNVLLTGNKIPSAELEAILAGLNSVRKNKDQSFKVGDDILSSTEAVDLLNQSQGVILVAKKNKSTIRSMYREYERVLESSAKMVGYIFVNS